MLADLILASYAPTAVRPPAPWCADLAAILAGPDLHAVFQPIVDFADARIVGYEGLIRGPSDSALHSPLNLFEAAEQCQQLLALERACRQVTLRRFAELRLQGGAWNARDAFLAQDTGGFIEIAAGFGQGAIPFAAEAIEGDEHFARCQA